MEISNKQQAKLNKILKKYQLKLVILFGSFASGKNHKNSDLDLAVLGLEQISFENQIVLINEFTQLFSQEVDLTVLNNANPLLGFQISKNSSLLAGKQADFLNFKLQAFHAFNDYAPYFEMERKLNKRIVQSYAN
ncbi:MAG: nucleotidyltransferase domain-containing protein [Candidatus Moraniibacteriota bacterium]